MALNPAPRPGWYACISTARVLRCRKAHLSCARRWNWARKFPSSAPLICWIVRFLPSVPGGNRGPRRTPASCTTPVAEGMVVHTQNAKLAKLRRGVMELYISDHPLDCLMSANGDCELQDMAGAVGLREVRYGYNGENHLDSKKDGSNPYFQFDPASALFVRAACGPARKCRGPLR